MTDKAKLEIWNQMCLRHGWAKPRELDTWLLGNGIRFTGAGDTIPSDRKMMDNEHNVATLVNGCKPEMLATLILEALIGSLIFPTIEVDRAFWSEAVKRYREEFQIALPKEIVPNYVEVAK